MPDGREEDPGWQGHRARDDPAIESEGRGTELESRRHHSATDAAAQRGIARSARSPDCRLRARRRAAITTSQNLPRFAVTKRSVSLLLEGVTTTWSGAFDVPISIG